MLVKKNVSSVKISTNRKVMKIWLLSHFCSFEMCFDLMCTYVINISFYQNLEMY